MEIPADKVLNKMEELIQQAKAASTIQKKQSYIMAIKSLCEIMTEEEQRPIHTSQVVQAPANQQMQASAATVANQQPISIENANGSSLLDF
ncbi:MAG: DUF5327 family protein [Bacillus sp. (in: firmicutes)]